MTFNPTHRVATEEEWLEPKNGDLLELMQHGPGASHYRSSTGRCWWLNHDYVEPIPLEEPVKLEPGKAAIISFSGTFSDDGYFAITKQVSDAQFRQFHPDVIQHHVSIEYLPDPLPTTPGSVVWTKEGDPYSGLLGPFPWMLNVDNEWTDGLDYRRQPEQMAELTIVRTFDAEAPRE